MGSTLWIPYLTVKDDNVRVGKRSNDCTVLVHINNLSGSIDEPIEVSIAINPASRGANLEAKDEDEALPLHDASAGGFTDIVRLLINTANNSDCVNRMLETVDSEGDTPLHHAARGEHKDVVDLLLAAGASLTKTNLYGKTPGELSDPWWMRGEF
ncbi:Ankyrin repeat [Macleaya cordata]|uniref:Ankyrin repeat n=1 Tax=Macleaya cordata TaxID=56857 RepID=A0A200RA13_MACCD|nr:Ankyrin repeat [Macleaya cordata]